ncbi:putative Hsp70 protein [Trypanosoma vivax]|uniref:Uncharacterized protein n=1 Tax=Trypanosoma vivax (strain Y486) TaxID=1055687 RepID=G0U4H7_TRYVY|nr:putative Hsp70 protein [Trypanosoma vivax]CCC52341.1 conserved hypothetical protein [Trypanosoma vivax Y486]
MHAVSISLGTTSAIVAVANVSHPSAGGRENAAPIRVVANSSGHRITPTMAAFAEHNELLFGEDARSLYTRTPHVVVPYVLGFAAVAHQHRVQHSLRSCAKNEKSDSDGAVEVKLYDVIHRGIEASAKLHYKGHCPLVEDVAAQGQLGFRVTHDDGTDTAAATHFFEADQMLVRFFDHVKRHTVDAACGLVTVESAGTESAPTRNDSQADDGQPRIVLTVVVPRHLFPETTVARQYAKTEADGSGPENGGSCFDGASNTFRRVDELQWLRDAVNKSHLGSVTADVSIIFSDEAALLGMDALASYTQPPHPMAGRYFLLPPSAMGDCGETSAWSLANVLVVDWGALGVSFSCLRLEGGCLVGQPCPDFMRSSPIPGITSCTARYNFLASTQCGGGDAVNVALRDCLATAFMQQQRRALGYTSLSDFPPRAQRRLLLAAEEKKIVLSRAAQVPVEIEALAEGIDLRDNTTLSCSRVSAAMRGEWGFFAAFEKALQEYLKQRKERGINGVEEQINVVLLCGGMFRLPFVAQTVRKVFVQYASALNESHSQFARDLVIMESGALTTVFRGGGDESQDMCEPQTVENNMSVGAEEIFCFGGCLHSLHLALITLEWQSFGARNYTGSLRKGDAKKKAASLSWQKQRRLEEVCSTWRAFMPLSNEINKEISEKKHNGLLALRCAIFLYTQATLDELHRALGMEGRREDDPVKLPRSALITLFPTYCVIPARAVMPLGSGRPGSLALYVFSANESCCVATEEEGEAPLSVVPVNGTPVILTASACEDAGITYYIVFTLSPMKSSNNSNGVFINPSDNSGSCLQMHVQLVRVTAGAQPPFVVRPGMVETSATIEL